MHTQSHSLRKAQKNKFENKYNDSNDDDDDDAIYWLQRYKIEQNQVSGMENEFS